MWPLLRSPEPWRFIFSRRIRRKYQEEVDFLLPEQELPFRNEALLDVVTRRPACFFGKLVSAQA